MIRRFFVRLRNRDGQALIFSAIVFPLVLLFLAFVVDTAHAFVDQRHLQNTADAASLAAAQQLNGGSPGCTSLADCATQYVSYNSGPTISGGTLQTCNDSSGNPITSYITQDMISQQLKDQGGCYQSPYAYDPSKPTPPDCSAATGTCADRVAVWLYECNPTFFGGILGISNVCVTVHSVSQGSTSPLLGTITNQGFTTSDQTILGTSTSTIVNNGSTSYSTTTTQVVIKGTTNAGTTVTVPVTNSIPTTVTLPANDAALFAADTTCSASKGLMFEKNNQNIMGYVHSNGSITYSGSGKYEVAGGTYGSSSCVPNAKTKGGFDTPPTLDASFNVTPVPWPVNWIYTDICSASNPDYKSGASPPTTYALDSSTPGGTYCATQSITLNGQPKGPVTMVAPSVQIDGNNQTLTGDYTNAQGYQLLAYATGSGITVSGNSNTFNGYLFAPTGLIDVKKNNGANGFWEALDIDIEFNNFSMVGTGPGGTPTPTPTTTVVVTNVASVSTGTTVNDITTQSVSVSTSSTPGSTSLKPTTSTVVLPGTTQDPVTNTVTTGVSTNLKLKQ